LIFLGELDTLRPWGRPGSGRRSARNLQRKAVGFIAEYDVGMLAGMVRLMHIAPVGREMILNYVAQHSLGLPKAY
jgi:hypothetical protein